MATIDEQNKKKSTYTPMNAYTSNLEAVAQQQAYLAQNPDAGKAFTQSEKQELFGGITDPIWNTGVYTKDKDGAYAAGAQWGVEVTPTTYFNGDPGFYYVPDVKDRRTVQQGSSGADEGLMNNHDYAIVQQQKEDWTKYNDLYNQVKDTDAALAAQYLAARDKAHENAERIRVGYGYSGGEDGSMYLTQGQLGIGGNGSNQLSGGGYGSYGGGSQGSGGSGGSGTITDLSEWIEAMYNAKTEADMAALEAVYKQNMAALERAEVGVQEAYQDNRNQTTGASELAARNFAEYANAYGLNSGTGGQAELARNVTLQNNLNSINMQESQTLAELDLAKANTETEYNLAIAQAEATGDYAKASALYQEKVRVQEALTQLMMWEAEMAFQKQQYADGQAQQQWENAFTMQQYQDAMAQQYANLTGSNVGSGTLANTPVAATPVVNDTPGVSYNNGGLTAAQVKELQNHYGLTADGFWGPNSQANTGYSDAKQAWDAYQASKGGPGGVESPTDVSGGNLKNYLFGSKYNDVYGAVRNMVGQGMSDDGLKTYLNTVYKTGGLTDMGVENLLASFDIGGYRSGQ